MKNPCSHHPISLRSVVLAATLILCSLGATSVARAADLLGFYVGAAYGQAHIRARVDGLNSSIGTFPPLGGFDSTDSAYQAMAGIRVLSFLGAEVAYVDLGRRSIRGPGTPLPGQLPGSAVVGEQVSQKGEAAFAMLYLPVPIIDVYVKAGVSRINTDMSATAELAGVGSCAIDNPDCAVVRGSRSTTDVSFAYGAGLQWKLGQWAVRGEYERFDAAGANPSLLSIGMTYWIF